MIKKSIFFSIILVITVTTFYLMGSDLSLAPSKITVTGTSSGIYKAEIEITYSGITADLFEGTSVSYLHDHFMVTGPVQNNMINESDFLFAGINHDLNSDGDFSDSFMISQFRGVMSLDKVPLKPIISPYKYSNMNVLQFLEKGATMRTTRLLPQAEPFVVYEYKKEKNTITIGLGSKDRPLEIVDLSNPCLLVEVLRPVDNTGSKPAFTLSGGTPRITYTNEKLLKGYDDFWLVSQWVALPIDIKSGKSSPLTLSINNIEKPFVVRANGMMSLEKGVVLKSRPLVKVIK